SKDLDTLLQQATEHLLYQSETDEPFEVIHWHNGAEKLDAAKVRELSGNPPGTPVQTQTLDDFFEELVTPQKWHGEQEKADVQKYQNLLKLIKQQLTEAQVFRVGETDLDIYIVGRTREGDWAGLKTRAVET